MEPSDRQIKLLKILVEEYITNATPVGSEMLDKKHNLGVSPATIRNEMAKLTEMGYLKQPHTSAGRIPTSKALKFYIKQLMNEQNLSVAEEVSVKESVWDSRKDTDTLLRKATKTLAEKTKCIGMAITANHKIYQSGHFHILDMPEFFDIDVAKTVFSLLDESNQLLSVLERAAGDEPIHILLGEDFEDKHLEPVSIIFSDFMIGDIRGSIGVIGPARQPFDYIIPLVRHLSLTIQEISNH